MRRGRWSGVAVLGVALGVGSAEGCGARSALVEPALDVVDGGPGDASGNRDCVVLDCFGGHACCAGGCAGPAVALPSDCCACLADEVSSADCGGACGGG